MLCTKTTVFHLSKAFSLLPVLIYGFFCIAWINTKNEILSGRTSSVCSESTNVWLFYLDSSSRTQLQAPFNFLCLPCLKVISVEISVIMHTQHRVISGHSHLLLQTKQFIALTMGWPTIPRNWIFVTILKKYLLLILSTHQEMSTFQARMYILAMYIWLELLQIAHLFLVSSHYRSCALKVLVQNT